MKNEVKNYLELQCQRKEDYDKDVEFLQKNIPFDWTLSVRDFYSQKFMPELITKLFICHSWNVVLDENLESYLKTEFYNDFKPETLNDFIRDCQRAGIKLYWKVQK